MTFKKLLLLAAVFLGTFALFQSCGTSDDGDDGATDSPTTPDTTWADVQPIIVKSCAGGTSLCHNNTFANTYNWSDATEETFAETSADYSAFKRRLNAGNMPPDGDDITLSNSDRTTLEGYFR